MSRSNYDYWFERERDNLANYRLSEVEADRELQRIYFRMLDDTQAQIDAFWGRFANREEITINEAMQRVSQFDVDAYSRKVARVIQSHKVRGGLPAQAQQALRLYNATMRVNRLEMLRSTIGVELINNFSHAEQFMTQQLTSRTMGELRRQAGILGNTIVANQQSARAIVGASFRNATFSQRLWGHQQRLSNELGSLLSRGLIQGRGSRELSRELRRLFMGSDGALFNAQRLMQTELARVQTEAQMLSFERNGFRQYVFLAIEDEIVCEKCSALDGKVFNVSDKQVGANAPPIHPHCVLPETQIIAPDAEAMTKSLYSGDVIKVRTANARTLAVTPNHIVLTSRGWVRAKNLVEGDQVINYLGWDEFTSPLAGCNPADDDSIPTIEQFFASIVKSGFVAPVSVPASSVHLKGDVVAESEIDIVLIDSFLRDKLNSSAAKLISDSGLVGTAETSERVLDGSCTLAKLLMCTGLIFDGIMSSFDVSSVFFCSALTHHELVGLRVPADYDVRFVQSSFDHASANSEMLGNSVDASSRDVEVNDGVDIQIATNTSKHHTVTFEGALDSAWVNLVEIGDFVGAFPGIIEFDNIVDISVSKYCGHVYDISSLSTLYIANGILSSNCRCSAAAHRDEAEYREWLQGQSGNNVSSSDGANTSDLQSQFGNTVDFKTGGMDSREYAWSKTNNSKNYSTVYIEDNEEFARVMSALNTDLTEEERRDRIVTKAIGDYTYIVENNGFNNYRIIGREPIPDALTGLFERDNDG